MTDVPQTVGDWLIILSAVIGSASVAMHARVPWWRSPVGRHLMAYMLAMAAVLDLSTIRILFGDSVNFALLRLIVFTAVPAVMAQRLVIQIRAQRGAIEESPHADTPDSSGPPGDSRRDSDR